MKHTFYLSFIILFFIGCGKQQPAEISVSNPIIPIHYTGDSMRIHLTDYMPWLEDSIVDITGENKVRTLSVNGCDIVVLPHLDYRQGLVTIGYAGEKAPFAIRFGLRGTKNDLHILALLDNTLLPQECISQEDTTYLLTLPSDIPSGRSFIRIFAQSDSVLYNDILVPLQDGHPVTDVRQLTRHDDQTQVLYSMLVDRFNNGNTENDWKLNSPEVLDIVDYQGGDFKGITAKIQEGFFDSLGITTLWISPITQNPWDAWGCYRFLNGNKYDSTKTYTKFSAYHGYWPLYTTVLEKRFGTDAELKELLATAHAHNMNVILDYVANHMHINAPTLQEHPDWHTDSILPDGRRNFELWDEARLTTWFDAHIPTLDLEREDVCDPMTDSALYWLENYELDGFRHDACKHIPECYWRMLTHKMVTRFPNRHIWMIGETYGSSELINTYVKSGMLNAQFDFNVYFTAIHAFAGDGSFCDINRVILESLATYGAHHTMGNISGNHDQARFASLADGAVRFDEDPKEAGWTRDVTPASELAYTRAIQLEVLNLTIPGVPCIYQGDEYGEIGAGDPDNRHMMRFEGLNEQEQTFRSKMQQLIGLRRQSMALMYGDYVPLVVNDDTLEYERVYMGEHVRVKIVRDQQSEIAVWYEE
ncbi:MAG: alpha-amylase family glycosyl hydrolase [Paludibacteraceae bacterium]|nr:alpha-amylase family glycosyl hydrolase [Paludibacteraceae bacterium]